MLGVERQRSESFDECQPTNPLGRDGGCEARNARTERVPKEVKALPPEGVSRSEHVSDVVDKVVVNARRPRLGAPVTRKLKRNQSHALEQGRESGKAGRIIQPPVQRHNGLGRARPPCLCRKAQVGRPDFNLFGHSAGALLP